MLVNKHNGLYEITFTGYTLPQHTQFAQGDDSVEFAKGVVRIHTFGNATAPRKELQVVRAVNIGVTGAALKIYASDPTFPATSAELATYDGKLMADAATTVNQKVNYYPGYKVYLYADATHGFTETNLLPGEDHDVKYSVFGLRSHDFALNYFSLLSVPALMYAKKYNCPSSPSCLAGACMPHALIFLERQHILLPLSLCKSHILYNLAVPAISRL